MKQTIIALTCLLCLLLPTISAFAGNGTRSQSHAVIPASGAMIVYLPQQKLYFPKNQQKLGDPYVEAVSKLHTNAAMWSAFHTLADNTSWISHIMPGRFDDSGALDLEQLHDLSTSGPVDVILTVRPTAEFTPDLKGLVLAIRIMVFYNTPSGPMGLKHKEITETVSLEHAGTPLTPQEIASIGSGDSVDTAKARAAVWFSHGATRVKTALLLDLIEAIEQLHAFFSHST